jgi:hypothetical protein
MTEDEIDRAIGDAETRAQRAAELRLMDAYERFGREMDDDDEAWDGWEGGAYCGCDTCLVREVLTAAWPDLRRAARLEAGLTSDD